MKTRALVIKLGAKGKPSKRFGSVKREKQIKIFTGLMTLNVFLLFFYKRSTFYKL